MTRRKSQNNWIIQQDFTFKIKITNKLFFGKFQFFDKIMTFAKIPIFVQSY